METLTHGPAPRTNPPRQSRARPAPSPVPLGPPYAGPGPLDRLVPPANGNLAPATDVAKLILNEFRALQLDRLLATMSVFDLIDHCALLFEDLTALDGATAVATYVRAYLMFNYFINTFIMIHFNGFAKFMDSSPQDFIIYLNLYNFFRSDDILGAKALAADLPSVRRAVVQFLDAKNLLSFDVALLYSWLDEYIEFLKNKDDENTEGAETAETTASPYPVQDVNSDLESQASLDSSESRDSLNMMVLPLGSAQTLRPEPPAHDNIDDIQAFTTRYPTLDDYGVTRFLDSYAPEHGAAPPKLAPYPAENGLLPAVDSRRTSLEVKVGTARVSSDRKLASEPKLMPELKQPIGAVGNKHRKPPVPVAQISLDPHQQPQRPTGLDGRVLSNGQIDLAYLSSSRVSSLQYASPTPEAFPLNQPYFPSPGLPGPQSHSQVYSGHQNYPSYTGALQQQPHPGTAPQSYPPVPLPPQLPQNYTVPQGYPQGYSRGGPSAPLTTYAHAPEVLYNRPPAAYQQPSRQPVATYQQPPVPPRKPASDQRQDMRRSLAICGLKNLGSSCYINLTVQMLLGLTFERVFFEHVRPNKRLPLLDALYGLMATFHNNGGASIAPTKFMRTLSAMKPDFNIPFEQQDAQEFLLFVLDKLHEEQAHQPDVAATYLDKYRGNVIPAEEESYLNWCKKLTQQEGQSFVTDTVQGHIQSKLVCNKCNHKSISYSLFTILSLPIPLGNNVNLTDCLKYYTQDEVLSGDNAWRCPHCDKSTEANPMEVVFQPKRGLFRLPKRSKSPQKKVPSLNTVSTKQLSFIHMPAVMFIHLSRFGSATDKLNTTITYPLRLSFQHVVHDITYKLTGLVNHYGSLKSGHYTALTNKARNDLLLWCYFDDDNVRFNVPHGNPAYPDRGNIHSSDVYVLCYERV